MDTFGLRLRIARHHAGDMSIEAAASRCGIVTSTWSAWEREQSSPRHRRAVAQLIATELDVDPDWLENGGPLASPDPTDPGKRPDTVASLPRVDSNHEPAGYRGDLLLSAA